MDDGDGKFVTTLHWVQQNGAGGFARFLFSDTPRQSIEGDIQQARFGAGLKCTAFAHRQVNQPKGYLKIQVARQIQEQDKWQKARQRCTGFC